MKARLTLPAALLIAVTAIIVFRAQTAPPVARSDDPTNQVLARARDIELGNVQPKKYEQRVSSGVVRAVLEATGDAERRAARSAPTGPFEPTGPSSDRGTDRTTVGCANVFKGAGDRPDDQPSDLHL